MYFDIRSLNNESIEKLLCVISRNIKKLEKKYNGVKIELNQELSILPLENIKPKTIKNLCKDLELEENSFVGGCEAGYYQKLGGNAIVFGVGNLDLAHKPNEFAEIQELSSYYDKLESIINLVNKI